MTYPATPNPVTPYTATIGRPTELGDVIHLLATDHQRPMASQLRTHGIERILHPVAVLQAGKVNGRLITKHGCELRAVCHASDRIC